MEPGRSRSFCALPARLLTAVAVEAEGDLLLLDGPGHSSLLRRVIPPGEVALGLLRGVALEAALLALADADVAVGAAEREVEGAEPLHEGLAPCHHVLHDRISVAGGL